MGGENVWNAWNQCRNVAKKGGNAWIGGENAGNQSGNAENQGGIDWEQGANAGNVENVGWNVENQGGDAGNLCDFCEDLRVYYFG